MSQFPHRSGLLHRCFRALGPALAYALARLREAAMRMNEKIGVALLGQGAERLPGPMQAACAFTRANAPMFFTVGASLLLTARWHSLRERAAYAFRDDPALRVWLLQECAPRRLARVQRLREYATFTWPELDWNAADERFNKLADSNTPPLEPSLAQRVLAQ